MRVDLSPRENVDYNPEDKLIDLAPHQWESSDAREKPHEPFFGYGAWPFVEWLIVYAALAAAAKWLFG